MLSDPLNTIMHSGFLFALAVFMTRTLCFPTQPILAFLHVPAGHASAPYVRAPSPPPTHLSSPCSAVGSTADPTKPEVPHTIHIPVILKGTHPAGHVVMDVKNSEDPISVHLNTTSHPLQQCSFKTNHVKVVQEGHQVRLIQEQTVTCSPAQK